MRGAAACLLAAGCAAANAQTWRLEPSISAQITWTDNVFLSPQRTSDWVGQITPTLSVNERGAHTTLLGTISAPILLYARTSGNNDVRPEVNLAGTAELYPRLVFIDASALVTQQYLSPFGPRPQNLDNATANRYAAQAYQVAPYLKGEAGSRLRYELRDNNVWTRANGAPDGADSSYTNEIVGSLTSEPRPVGGALTYDRMDTRFSGQDPLVTEIARGELRWQPDPQWQLSATGGYEDDRYVTENFSGPTYGAGVRWRPTGRTNVEARWEHRFFGGSYHATFDHRTTLTVWSLTAFRDITSYPQQLGTLPAGGDVNALLNSLFASQVPDPAQRQALVDQFVRERGLPRVLASPLSLVSQQVTLQQSVQGTAGIVGARNSIILTAFRTRSEPVANAGLFTDLLAQVDNTQTGANVVWSYRLTQLYTLATSANWARAVANDPNGEQSRQSTLQTVLFAPMSPLTSLFGGARYQHLRSNFQDDVNETAVFIGISHRFR